MIPYIFGYVCSDIGFIKTFPDCSFIFDYTNLIRMSLSGINSSDLNSFQNGIRYNKIDLLRVGVFMVVVDLYLENCNLYVVI